MADLSEFDNILDDKFDATKFANDLLLVTNENGTIDLKNSMKRVQFDINEVEKIYQRTVNDNSSVILDQLYNDKEINKQLVDGLLPGLKFLQLSYDRLDKEVLKSYESAQRLQLALNKIHQLSTLLRDSLLYLHLLKLIKDLVIGKEVNFQNSQKLAMLYQQLQIILQKNINLNSLNVIKQSQTLFLKDNKKKLISFLNNQLISLSMDPSKNIKELPILFNSIYQVSPIDFHSVLNKIIINYSNNNSALIIKTLNSVGNFAINLNEVIHSSDKLYQIEIILSEIYINDNNNSNTKYDTLSSSTSLLTVYSHRNHSNNSRFNKPKDIYWNKVSQLFKKELEISFNRGGPVGKNLKKNKDLLQEAITNKMSQNKNIHKENLQTMLQSISILL